MPETRLNEMLERLELVIKLGGVLKWIVVAAFGLGGWVAVLQLEVGNTRQTLSELQADRKERISAAEIWRHQKDKEDATRDALITQSQKMLEHQQTLLDHAPAAPR